MEEKVKLIEMRLKEIKEKGKIEVAILPWGSCEPHNLHLPYGTDTLTAEKISLISAEKASKKGANVIVLPSIPIGQNLNLFKFPLTLSFSLTTMKEILKDIIFALENHKIFKFVIINGHGGNEFKGLMRDFYLKTEVKIFLINWWTVFDYSQIIKNKGEHGDEAETSWMLYLYPELVELKWADKGKTKKIGIDGVDEGWVWITRPWDVITTNSGYGNPEKATKEKGKIIVEKATDKIADFLVKIST